MGTTLDTLQSAQGAGVVFVLCIEGCEHLITDGDVDAVATAWAATPWSSVLPGLQIKGGFEQSFDPWRDEIEVPSLSVRIVADQDETIAKLIAAAGAGTESVLLGALDNNDSAEALIADNTQFTSGGGTAYIGPECIPYASAATTGKLTTLTRGKFAPFAANGLTNRFGRYHPISSFGYQTHIKPDVTSAPRQWLGRHVGIWMHRVVGGVVDVKAQAQPIFGGTIADIDDDGLSTTLELEDVRGMLRSTELLPNQFTSRVIEGVFLVEGVTFRLRQHDTISAVETWRTPGDLVVVTGASGANQIETGRTSLDDLISALNDWVRSEAAAGNISGEWSVRVGTDDDGQVKTIIECEADSGTTDNYIELRTTSFLFRFLGWGDSNVGYTERSAADNSDVKLVSDAAPYRTMAFQQNTSQLDLDQAAGDWIDNRAWLPPNIRDAFTSAGENWGILDVGGQLFIAQYSSDALFTDLSFIPELQRQVGTQRPDQQFDVGVRADTDGEILVRQIVFLQGSFADLVLRLFASTGTSGYNHATYDAFPYGLGAAIPWELLGDEFVTSVQSLTQSDGVRLIMIDEPTSIEKVLVEEMLLRGANLVWKGGHLEFVTWQTATSGLETITLTESNKAEALGTEADELMVLRRSTAHIKNAITIRYGRDLAGTFHHSIDIIDPVSISRYGSRVFEINARNTWAHITATGDSIAELAAWINAQLPNWSKEVFRGSRSISFELYEDVAPGSIAIVSDNNARDPADGVRGIDVKPAILMAHRYDWGSGEPDSARDMWGEVEVALFPVDRVAPYSPSANLNQGATGGGYQADTPTAGKSTLTCNQSDYSETSEAADVTNFNAGDAVKVLERDPVDPAAAQSWTATVDSQSGNTDVVIDTNLAGFDSSKNYVIISDDYSSAAASQRSDAYQADDADHRIEDLAPPYEYGQLTSASFTAEGSDTLPELGADDLFGDGRPLSVNAHRAPAVFINNLLDYKSTIQIPAMFSEMDSANVAYIDAGRTPAAAAGWQLVMTLPIFYGIGDMANFVRNLTVAPTLAVSSGVDTVFCRITLSKVPIIGIGEDDLFDVAMPTPKWQKQFSSSSTTPAILTAQSMPAMFFKSTGLGYMHVEVKGGTTAHGRLYGRPVYRLGVRT